MARKQFYIVDVFAESKYAGNQLAVFRNAELYGDREMQKIAVEMGFSETTFIYDKRLKDGSFRVRIFTPAREIPFAGHPTIGTAFVILKEILKSKVGELKLKLKAGPIPVTPRYDGNDLGVLTMRQIQPGFGRMVKPDEIAKILHLNKKDISRKYPCEEVSTGLPSLIVPLNSLDGLKRCQVNRDLYFRLIKRIDAKALFPFTTETNRKSNDLSVRCFPIFYGIDEDPATGSANGCLAAYLSKYKVLGSNKVNATVEQGYEIGRPSKLYIKAEPEGKKINIFVGGKAVMAAKGEFL